MESLTHPSIGEISKAFLETVWKYLLLLIILQKSFFFFCEKVEDSDVRPVSKYSMSVSLPCGLYKE